jgi:hypothetical protein
MKHYLAFHTVFILNENIKWLEEFIIYYKHIGFDHFYLYDNEGSNGGDGTQTHNKYNFPITTISTVQNQIDLQNILSKYNDCITYIKWQPKYNDIIIYGQTQSMNDCLIKYGCDNEWIAFFDFDEFIYSATHDNFNLSNYLKSLSLNISCVKLIQKKFLDRFLTTETFITQEYKCISENTLDTTNWAPKNIVRCKDVVHVSYIHEIIVKTETYTPDINILRFNHYNFNKKQSEWMKGYYNRDNDYEYVLDSEDYGMKQYEHLFVNN